MGGGAVRGWGEGVSTTCCGNSRGNRRRHRRFPACSRTTRSRSGTRPTGRSTPCTRTPQSTRRSWSSLPRCCKPRCSRGPLHKTMRMRSGRWKTDSLDPSNRHFRRPPLPSPLRSFRSPRLRSPLQRHCRQRCPHHHRSAGRRCSPRSLPPRFPRRFRSMFPRGGVRKARWRTPVRHRRSRSGSKRLPRTRWMDSSWRQLSNRAAAGPQRVSGRRRVKAWRRDCSGSPAVSRTHAERQPEPHPAGLLGQSPHGEHRHHDRAVQRRGEAPPLDPRFGAELSPLRSDSRPLARRVDSARPPWC